ncbi:MAG: serine/threonine-protein kinase [Polyangia bacterium]
MQPPDPSTDSIGSSGASRQIGPYRVIRKIGAGGMGEVFEARHTTIERRVAIKVLRPTLAQNPELNTRFINEARAVNIVEHPGIVQVFDYGRLPDGTAYIVMEYLHGVTLSGHMGHSVEHLPIEDVLRFSRQIASVLAAAHAKGIIHRDLKPDNVMLIPDPELDDPLRIRLKLLDFGVAKLGSSLASGEVGVAATQNSLVVGTPEYMSPEQCRNSGKVTGKADVYSLGVILFESHPWHFPVENSTAWGVGEPLGNDFSSAYCTGCSTKRASRSAARSASESERRRVCTDKGGFGDELREGPATRERAASTRWASSVALTPGST